MQNSTYSSSLSKSQKITKNNNKDNVKVVIRCRPPLDREIQDGRFISTVQVSPDHNKICIFEYQDIESVPTENLDQYFENQNNYNMNQFAFDFVYDQQNTQEEVYNNTAKQAVLSTLEGYNSTIIAYGQTGTGKTYTMEGFTYDNQDPQRGVIPRSVDEIFKYIQLGSDSRTTFMVRASYLQIYNENISDLLRTERQGLSIREDKKRGVFVEGLSEWAVRSPMEIYSLLKKGANSRSTASTKMNDMSSRSHAVFILTVEQMEFEEQNIQSNTNPPKKLKIGKLNLVDLAGSERARVTGATGQRLEECKQINKSLSALGNVIAALTDNKLQPRAHIPYRDSKITRLLEDSLGGNCKTTIIAMISPSTDAFGESLSTLKFANRAKNIKNIPVINEDQDQRALLRKYESELKRLKHELDEKNSNIIDKARLFQLEKQRQQAEADRDKMVEAYEAISKEFFKEREEKKNLMDKIKGLNSQLLVGGRKVEDTPQFRSALEESQKMIMSKYEEKMQEIEKERQYIEENKAQVDRYKQLLIKQRDIMIALTNRLNERDESILQLQDELDAYDKIYKETEEVNQDQIERVQQLEQFIRQNGLEVPERPKSEEKNNEAKNDDQNQQNGINLEGSAIPFNVTQYNLEEKVGTLQKENELKKNEIQRLQDQIQNIHVKINQDNNKLMDEFEKEFEERVSNIQQKYEEEILVLTENAKKYERNQAQFLDLIQLKGKVDQIIQTLSQPTDLDKQKLVAQDLIFLQQQVADTLNYIITTKEDGNSADLSSSQRNQNSFSQISQNKIVRQSSQQSNSVNGDNNSYRTNSNSAQNNTSTKNGNTFQDNNILQQSNNFENNNSVQSSQNNYNRNKNSNFNSINNNSNKNSSRYHHYNSSGDMEGVKKESNIKNNMNFQQNNTEGLNFQE
ncbi:P-loop containing nucleoside triphosphate hydrolase [Pseudocohnilembus persalinus]|uniref:Kinesin-like protein n=1 Tax=Pseudocohnilembus persalinus TaxID=266149 RepID=A0A0V0QCS1_PSEPJ|nr:P-loop containing nucleoside triphosphate hydrolase [Pseudocohnilembus persalinus]|eukprot:KRW99943.1 P-loop containing nucleoside triphosphate hydrolase [Pseudocohnilembus persalinus]